MTFARALNCFEDRAFELRPQGFFNVESGKFTVSTGYYPQCDCRVRALGFTDCQLCGRGADESTFSFPSGDGDGIFVAYAIVMVGENPGEEDVTIGMMAIFDYKFQIANVTRKAIENETLPKFPWDLARQFENCKGTEIGDITVKRSLLIGNGPFSWNGQDAVVDFPDCLPGEYNSVVYFEEVDASVEGTAERLSRTQGMPRDAVERLARAAQSTFEEMTKDRWTYQPDKSFAPIVPRAVIVIHEDMRVVLEPDESGEVDEFVIEDWDLLESQYRFGALDLSHKKSMAESVIWENVLLAREYDRAAGQCSDAEALRLHLMIRSWLYQGRSLGMENCINFLAGFRYEPSSDEEILMLMRRGLADEASKYL